MAGRCQPGAGVLRAGGQAQRHAAGQLEVVQVQGLVHRVRVALPHPHGDRRQAARGEGVGIQAAVGNAVLGTAAGGFHGGRGRDHARLVQGQLERLVVLVCDHLDPPGDPFAADHLGGGATKGKVDLAHDALAERRVVAARLGPYRGLLRNHVGGLAGVDHAHVAGAAVAFLLDLAVPAAAIQVGDGARRDGDGAYAALGGGAGVAGHATHLDLQAVGTGGADHQARSAAPVPVEGQTRIAQERLRHPLRAVQADFLLHEPAERDRWVRQSALGDFQRGGEQCGAGGAVVGAEAGVTPRRAHRPAAQHRLAADADRHGVEMARQQPARPPVRARKLEHHVAGIAAQGGALVHLVRGDQLRGDPGVAEPAGDVVGHLRLFAALAGNRHQLQGQPPRPLQVGLRRRHGGGIRAHRPTRVSAAARVPAAAALSAPSGCTVPFGTAAWYW